MRRGCSVGIFRFGDDARGEEVIQSERVSRGAMGSHFEEENNGELQFKYRTIQVSSGWRQKLPGTL